MNYAGGAEEADALVGKIQAAGGRAISVQADVADSTADSRPFDAAEAEFGGVDVLVNNAGVMMLKPIAESDDAFFDRQVAINAVAPGPVATALFLNGKSPELIEGMPKMNPLERLGTPEDIASAVSFLTGPDGGWINGQVLRANGGMV